MACVSAARWGAGSGPLDPPRDPRRPVGATGRLGAPVPARLGAASGQTPDGQANGGAGMETSAERGSEIREQPTDRSSTHRVGRHTMLLHLQETRTDAAGQQG